MLLCRPPLPFDAPIASWLCFSSLSRMGTFCWCKVNDATRLGKRHNSACRELNKQRLLIKSERSYRATVIPSMVPVPKGCTPSSFLYLVMVTDKSSWRCYCHCHCHCRNLCWCLRCCICCCPCCCHCHCHWHCRCCCRYLSQCHCY